VELLRQCQRDCGFILDQVLLLLWPSQSVIYKCLENKKTQNSVISDRSGAPTFRWMDWSDTILSDAPSIFRWCCRRHPDSGRAMNREAVRYLRRHHRPAPTATLPTCSSPDAPRHRCRRIVKTFRSCPSPSWRESWKNPARLKTLQPRRMGT
jgi:hypothetical protein